MTVWLQGERDGQIQPDFGDGALQGGHALEDEHGYVVAEEDLIRHEKLRRRCRRVCVKKV